MERAILEPSPNGTEPSGEAEPGEPSGGAPEQPSERAAAAPPAPALASVELPATARRATRRPVRLGLSIQYESRPDDPSLGRLVESTVWVNDAHPAYRRAAASRAEGYHLALTVAMALAAVAVEPPQQHAFVTAFLARWGEAVKPARHRGAARG